MERTAKDARMRKEKHKYIIASEAMNKKPEVIEYMAFPCIETEMPLWKEPTIDRWMDIMLKNEKPPKAIRGEVHACLMPWCTDLKEDEIIRDPATQKFSLRLSWDED